MKTFIRLSLCSLALVLTAHAGDQSKDAKAIQGTWLPVKAELGGVTMKDDFLKSIVLNLDGAKYEVTAESVDKGTYTIDPAAKPKTLDITGTEGPNVGKKIPAIYELEGDTLRVCYGLRGSPRPTEFKSLTGTQTFLVTYKRKKA
jgi:uncharacterized protein (TIGR03067 family)